MHDFKGRWAGEKIGNAADRIQRKKELDALAATLEAEKAKLGAQIAELEKDLADTQVNVMFGPQPNLDGRITENLSDCMTFF